MTDAAGYTAVQNELNLRAALGEIVGESDFDAIMWDLDGTILDTYGGWTELTEAVVRHHGGQWSVEDSVYIFGSARILHGERMALRVFEATGLQLDPMELYRQVADHVGDIVYAKPVFLPGAVEILEAVHDAGIAQALVTATQDAQVEQALAGFAQQPFDALVTGSADVPGKPNPAPYLLGAKLLGTTAERCLIFEDSPAGLQAARDSGAHVIDVNAAPLRQIATALGLVR